MLISQIVVWAAINFLAFTGGDIQDYQSQVVMLTGLTGLLTMIPCVCFYKKDKKARIAGGLLPERREKNLNFAESVLIFFIGTGFSQFVNILATLLRDVINYQQYQETVDEITMGKNLLTMILWAGIVAPLADISETARLCEERGGYYHIRRVFRSLSYESCSGSLRRHPWSRVRIFSGYHRKYLGQRPSPYGEQYLVAGI